MRRFTARQLRARSVPSAFRLTSEAAVELFAAAEGEEKKHRRFKMTAYTGAAMQVWGFWLPVVVDLAGIAISAKSRPILRDHDAGRIVGHTDAIKNSGRKIDLSGTVSAANEHAREVVDSADNGFPWQASIGCSVQQATEVRDGEKIKVNGRTFAGPVIVATKTTLREVSFVAIGADDDTSARIAAGASKLRVIEMNFEAWLKAKGFEADHLSEAQEKSLRAMFDAEVKAAGDPPDDPAGDPPAGDPPPKPAKKIKAKGRTKPPAADPAEEDEGDDGLDLVAEQRKLAAAEKRRVVAIAKLCGGKHDELEAQAIEEGWDETKTELMVLRAERPKGPGIHSRGQEQDATLEAYQGAMVLRAGLALDHRAWQTPQALALGLPGWLRRGLNDDARQQAMEAAHRLSDMSLVDICREALRISGTHVPSGRQEAIRASFSGGTLTQIFTTSVNASLLASYVDTPDTTMGWVAEEDVADFKTNDKLRMTTGPNLTRHPRGKTADHASRSDTGESYKVGRYSRKWVIDEQDVIDDSLGALSDVPIQFGAAARRVRPDLVYALLLANEALGADSVALFHSTHANLNTTAALAAATLKAAIAALEKQQENSVNLNLRATHLIVPSDLKHTAAELIKSSTILISWGADDETLKERGSMNTIAAIENLQSVSDSRLSNGVTDPATETVQSGSTSTWFLASALAHTIMVGYLRGTGRAPRVRSGVLQEGQYGQWFDVSLDIGAKALDFRGLQKNTA